MLLQSASAITFFVPNAQKPVSERCNIYILQLNVPSKSERSKCVLDSEHWMDSISKWIEIPHIFLFQDTKIKAFLNWWAESDT